MSIASKLTYLAGTKDKLKTAINYTGANLTNDTFRSYADKLKQGLLDVLNNGNDYLYNNFPQLNDEGQNISLTPTLEAPIKSELLGNTSQNGTPTPDAPVEVINATGRQVVKVFGKNLFDYDNLSSKIQTFTINGNASEFTINGIGTYDYPISLIGEYTFSGSWSTTNLNGQVRVVYEDDTAVNLFSSYSSSSTSGTINFTTTKNVKAIRFQTYNTSNITITNFQIEQGSTATEYEEYKEQSYEINLGKNLFDKSNITTGKTYTGTGDITTLNNSFIQETYIPVSSSTAYTMSTTNNYSSENDYRLVICEYKDDKTFIKRSLGGSVVGNKYTITTTENTKYVRLCASTVTLDELQFEKGQATSYVPYLEFGGIGDYQDSIRKGTGKNLLDKDNVIKVDNKILNDSGVETSDNTGGYTKMYIPVNPNTTYTVSGLQTNGTKRIYFFDNSKGFISRTSAQYNVSSFNFTTPNNCYYIDIQYYLTNNNFNTYQIEKGSTATDYEPYGSKGKWLLTKKIGKVVLDGSENWNINGYTFILNGTFPLTLNSLCSHFIKQNDDTWQSYNTSYRGKYTLANSINQFKVMPTDANINTVELWKQWLQSNNVLVYYVLATPTTTEITDSTLVNELNNLEDAKSYNGTTNIIITGETPADLKITVLKNE